MKKFNRGVAALLAGTMLLTGCSMLTAQGRRERAYDHYVRKFSHNRAKQQRRLSFAGAKIPKMHPSEPVTSTEVTGPESVTP